MEPNLQIAFAFTLLGVSLQPLSSSGTDETRAFVHDIPPHVYKRKLLLGTVLFLSSLLWLCMLGSQFAGMSLLFGTLSTIVATAVTAWINVPLRYAEECGINWSVMQEYGIDEMDMGFRWTAVLTLLIILGAVVSWGWVLFSSV